MYWVALLSTTEREKYREFGDVEDYYYNETQNTLILYCSDGITRAFLSANSPDYYVIITKQ